MPISMTVAFVLIGTSCATAFAALYAMTLLHSRWRPRPASVLSTASDDTVFLFDDGVLVDASDAARDFLAAATVSAAPWGKLCALLAPHFPGFEAQMQRLAEVRRLVLSGHGDLPMTLLAEWRSGMARITLSGHDIEGHALAVDRLSYQAMDRELLALRGTLDRAPVLVWRESGEGAVLWANRAYLGLAARMDHQDEMQTWPLPRLFDPAALQPKPGARPSGTRDLNARRAGLSVPDEKRPRWFDCFEFPQGDSTLKFALPADSTVQAEQALREFIQTLTKTFAQLPIGLAIFDRQRQLALFNPALIDLTGLGPDFLSARPTLFAFLDRMREDQRMPEPKNYKLWREQMAALERAASSGQYAETWNLPSGQTYRVTGRPHPDGATALLFEDISAEMSLTRRFRAELELGQSVIDSLPEAIAVFSPAGVLVLSNGAYARLWGTNPSATLTDVGFAESLLLWQSSGQPGPVWTRMRDFIGAASNRAEWIGDVTLKDGRKLACRITPVQGGATLFGFVAPSHPEAPRMPKRRPHSRSARARLIGQSPPTVSDAHETA